MKRSEVLAEMQALIDDQEYYGYGITAESILEIAEKHMLPNWYEKTYTDKLGYSRKELRAGWEEE